MGLKQAITPYLWFDGTAEEAATFYVSVFPNARILTMARYSDLGPGPEGSVMVVLFELDGMQFGAINGGPAFTLSAATSFLIDCKSQAEIDFYWETLGAGGEYYPCGWLRDRFGLSWQVNSSTLVEQAHADPATSQRVMAAMMKMTKIDLAALEAAMKGT